MKNPAIIFLSVLFILACSRQGEKNISGFPARGDRILPDTTVHTNDFYDNEITYVLGVPSIEISGETAHPETTDLNRLPLRSVIVKETILGSQGEEFVGAYRYDGYSLYDMRKGLFVAAGIDGYRAVFTYAEIMNRNDQSEVLLMDSDNVERAGKFSLLVSSDFFSDRAIKAVSEIHFVINQ